MNKGIQISGGTFNGGAFAAGDAATAHATNGRLSADVEAMLSQFLLLLQEQEIAHELSKPAGEAITALRKEAVSQTPDKSKIQQALEAIGKAEPAIKGAGAIVGSIATLFGLL